MTDSAGTAPAARGDDRPDRPGRSQPLGSRRAGGPGRIRSLSVFYKQVVAELRKVVWPDRKQLINYTSVVLVFVIVMVLLVALFDFVFSQGVLAVFG